MTDSDHTEVNEATDETSDSSVIKSLRAKIKELEKRPDRETLEAEIYAKLERRGAITEQLVALGFPSGLSEVIEGKLGEGEVTSEGVSEVLQRIGFQVEEVDAAPESSSEPSQESDLARVQALSASVRSAASGADLTDSVAKKIAAAKTPAELTAVMAEAGAIAQHI